MDRWPSFVICGSVAAPSSTWIHRIEHRQACAQRYVVSKAAVKAFTHKLQEQLQVDGLPVAVTLLRPSSVGTPLAEHAAVHLEGDARLPHPFYDPSVVAEAILDALQHDRGDVIVGGTSHLLVFLSHMFPGLHRLLALSSGAIPKIVQSNSIERTTSTYPSAARASGPMSRQPSGPA